MESQLGKTERAVAVLLTIAAVWLHVVAATSAGALWRDEANTVGLATLPAVGDVWKNLQYDSFPILWLMIVRAFSAVFGSMNDTAFRVLGIIIGLSVVGAIWFYARTFRNKVPLLSLALLGMSPSLILWGDSMRAYGFGILLILVTGALVWRFVEHPTLPHFSAAAVAAIASVHTLYYNSVLLLAFCAGAVAVCAWNRAWRTAALVVLIGAMAAVSLAPYAATITKAGSWNMLVRTPNYTWSFFWSHVQDTLQAGGIWAFIGWFEVLTFAMIAGTRAIVLGGKLKLPERRRDIAVFSYVTLVTGVVAVFLFLHTLSYVTQPWYYLTLLALAAVCMDALLAAAIVSPAARLARITGALLLVAATFLPAMRSVRTRLTNVDIVALRLESLAHAGDFVLVNEWPMGVSFERYYRAPARWETVPALGFHRFHRYDLIGQHMRASDQTLPVKILFDEIGNALRSGHRVFAVGGLVVLRPGEKPRVLGPVTAFRDWRQAGGYELQWSALTGYFIQQHALKVSTVPIRAAVPISRYEDPLLLVVEGWRP